MANESIAFGRKPDGTYTPVKVDENGNLVTTGTVGGTSAVQISNGTTTATITNVSGKQSLDVNVTDVTLSHVNDSVALGNGTSLLTSTTVASKIGVDTNIINSSVPVTAASLPLPTGAATETTLSTLNTKIPSGLTVTSSRLQVELPAGGAGLTNTELRASAVPVSLASTTITNFPATQAVSGTFFQATQPVSIAATVAVSGPLTDTQIRLTPLPISGTVSTGLSQPLTDTQIRATALPISGTVAVTGVATETTLSALNTKVPSGLTVTANRLQVELPAGGTGLTNTELRASAVPVSIAATVAVSGPLTDTQVRATALPVSLASTTITNFPASQAVTGTFFQATQPVSIAASVAVTGPLTDTQIRATALPVSGTFFQATQPISGTVTANATLAAETTKVIGTINIAASQAVQANAGTNLNTSALNLEATQAAMSAKLPATLGQKAMAASIAVALASDQSSIPVTLASTTITGSVAVTGPLTDTQLRATPVPISGTVTSNAGTNLNTSALNLEATQSAINTKLPSGLTVSSTRLLTDSSGVTQPVSAASLPLPAGASTSALQTTQDTSINTLLKPASTLAAVTTVTTVSSVTAITNALPTGANTIGTVNPPAITKGTQGTVGLTVQNIKDAGRNQTNLFMVLPILTTATDTLMSLTGYKGGAAVAATTTPAVVTTAKIYRLNTIQLTYVATATAGCARFTLRANTAGVVAIGSPAVASWVIGGPAVVAGVSQTFDLVLPDGMEFAAATGIGISMVGLSTVQALAIVGYGQITMQGYEY